MKNLERTAMVLVMAASIACGSACGGKKDKNDKQGKGTATGKVTEDPKAGSGGGLQAESGPAAGVLGAPTQGLLGGLVGHRGNTAKSKVDLSNLFAKSKSPAAPAPQLSVPGASAAVVTSAKGLWQLAPDNAAFGFVATDGSLVKLAAATAEIERLMKAGGPAGAALLQKLRAAMKGKIDPFALATWAKGAGVDLSRGMAFFMSTAGDPLMVLPVIDPAAFQKAIRDAKGNLGPKHCVMHAKGRYVCAEKLAVAKAAIAGSSPPIATKVASLPSWLRGDIELVAHLGSFPGAVRKLASWKPAITDIGTLAVAATMNNGKLSVHGWLEGKRSGPVGTAFANLPKAVLPKLAYGAVSWFHTRLPMGLIMAKAKPSLPIPGSDLRKDLFENMSGEALLFTRGKKLFAEHIVVTVKDPVAARRAVDAICKVLHSEGGLSGMRIKPGNCQGKLDLGKLFATSRALAPFVRGMPTQQVRISQVGKVVALGLGENTSSKGASRTHGDDALAREYLTGNWHFFHWGMAFDPWAIAPRVVRKRVDDLIIARLSPEQRQTIRFLRWMYAHVYEVGGALALREDGIYGLAQITTFAADDPATYRSYEAAVTKLIAGDRKGAKQAYAGIAKAQPNSLAGQHAAKLLDGVPITGQLGTAGLVALTTWLLAEKSGSP